MQTRSRSLVLFDALLSLAIDSSKNPSPQRDTSQISQNSIVFCGIVFGIRLKEMSVSPTRYHPDLAAFPESMCSYQQRHAQKTSRSPQRYKYYRSSKPIAIAMIPSSTEINTHTNPTEIPPYVYIVQPSSCLAQTPHSFCPAQSDRL
jgi:hypothetical protein